MEGAAFVGCGQLQTSRCCKATAKGCHEANLVTGYYEYQRPRGSDIWSSAVLRVPQQSGDRVRTTQFDISQNDLYSAFGPGVGLTPLHPNLPQSSMPRRKNRFYNAPMPWRRHDLPHISQWASFTLSRCSTTIGTRVARMARAAESVHGSKLQLLPQGGVPSLILV